MENEINKIEEMKSKSFVRLKELRQDMGMSLEKFGKFIGVGKATVFTWENGKRSSIKTSTIRTVSEKCHVSALWLMGFDVPKEEESLEHKTLRDDVTDELLWLDTKELQMVKKFIDDFIKPNRKK